MNSLFAALGPTIDRPCGLIAGPRFPPVVNAERDDDNDEEQKGRREQDECGVVAGVGAVIPVGAAREIRSGSWRDHQSHVALSGGPERAVLCGVST